MSTKPIFIIVISAIFLQLFGHYFATKLFVYDNFLALWPVLRVGFPALLLLFLAIPFRVLNFKFPVFDRLSFYVVLLSALGLALLAVYLGNFADDYLAYYRKGASIEYLRQSQRFEQFIIFTCSTLIAWEIFHRGFLLGTLKHCLMINMQVNEKSANAIAILFVAVFEALFHIKKPMYESMPLALASLVLSWLTLRTGSLWPALIIHLAIEVIFGYSAFVGW
ncbi:MAG: CPBP family intramembrane glutamic endopeptidase [Thalassotalea sp.]